VASPEDEPGEGVRDARTLTLPALTGRVPPSPAVRERGFPLIRGMGRLNNKPRRWRE